MKTSPVLPPRPRRSAAIRTRQPSSPPPSAEAGRSATTQNGQSAPAPADDRRELPGSAPPGPPPHPQGGQEECAEEHNNADDQQYSRPFATTPTIPSTIATITSSRKRAIIRFSTPSGRSAAGWAPLSAGARLLCVKIASSSPAGSSPSVPTDGAPLHLFLVIGDLEVPRTRRCVVSRHEHEPVPGRHSELDRGKRRHTVPGDDLDGFQMTIL